MARGLTRLSDVLRCQGVRVEAGVEAGLRGGWMRGAAPGPVRLWCLRFTSGGALRTAGALRVRVMPARLVSRATLPLGQTMK